MGNFLKEGDLLGKGGLLLLLLRLLRLLLLLLRYPVADVVAGVPRTGVEAAAGGGAGSRFRKRTGTRLDADSRLSPVSTRVSSSAASEGYKRQYL